MILLKKTGILLILLLALSLMRFSIWMIRLVWDAEQ